MDSFVIPGGWDEDLDVPEEAPISSDVNGAIEFLSSIKSYEQYKSKELREFRSQFKRVMEFAKRDMFAGKTEAEYRQFCFEQKNEKVLKQREKARDLHHIQTTQLRVGRINSLKKLCEEESGRLLVGGFVPDGVGEGADENDAAGAGGTKILPESDSAVQQANDDGEPRVLKNARSCYTCKARFKKLHTFYDQLCPECASLNWKKRIQTRRLVGENNEPYISIVTGGRVKIGLRIVLKLLRAGSLVVVTTRFPVAGSRVYEEFGEEYETWIREGRLHIVGLDLRDLVSVERFCTYVKTTFGHVDCIINNACQTVRRPSSYYKETVEKEAEFAGEEPKACLRMGEELEEESRKRGRERLEGGFAGSEKKLENGIGGVSMEVVDTGAPSGARKMAKSALLATVPLTSDDMNTPESLLPENLHDVNGQQLDLRTHNSWLLKIPEVSTPELVEAMFINVVSPFILNSRLIPIMTEGFERPTRPDRFIVNVSAMEGKFYRFKTPNHPHSNMAKAALNMMTRTCGDWLKEKRVWMNSVDTGWINDENPVEKAAQTAKNNNFQTPIDEIDAAARVLDCVLAPVTEERLAGVFIKDYREVEW